MAINVSSLVDKIAFSLINNTKILEFPKGNCGTSTSINMLCTLPLHESKLDSVNKDPDKLIQNLKRASNLYDGIWTEG